MYFLITDPYQIKEIDYVKSELQCKSGTVISLDKIDLALNHGYYDLFALNYGAKPVDTYQLNLDNNLDSEFRRLCLPTPPNDQKGFTLEELNAMGATPSSFVPERNYTLSIVPKNFLSEIIGYSTLVLIINIVIAEIIRRIFYYIVLGTIRPNKK